MTLDDRVAHLLTAARKSDSGAKAALMLHDFVMEQECVQKRDALVRLATAVDPKRTAPAWTR